MFIFLTYVANLKRLFSGDIVLTALFLCLICDHAFVFFAASADKPLAGEDPVTRSMGSADTARMRRVAGIPVHLPATA